MPVIGRIRFHPAVGRFIPDTVGQDVAVEIFRCIVLAPRPLAPCAERAVDMPYQIFSRQRPCIIHLGQCPVVESLPTAHALLSGPCFRTTDVVHHPLQAVHLRRVVIVRPLHLGYQQACGVQLLRVVLVMLQHGLQLGAVVARKVQHALHATVFLTRNEPERYEQKDVR